MEDKGKSEQDNFVPSLHKTRSREMGSESGLKISRTFSEVIWSLWSLNARNECRRVQRKKKVFPMKFVDTGEYET